MSHSTEAELARILSGASATVEASLALARTRLRPPGRPVPPLPPVGADTGSADIGSADIGTADIDGGDLLADRVLWRDQWDRAALARLCAQLGQRRLYAVEPVPTLGSRRLVQRLMGRWWRQRIGHDFDCDVPDELRRAGFQIFTIDRFAVDRLGLRSYAYLEVGPRRVPPVR